MLSPIVGGHKYGYGPSGIRGLVLFIVILLIFSGRL